MSASLIIEKFGSSYRLAKAISVRAGWHVDKTTVRRWTLPRKHQGTNNTIPYKFHQFIWDAAQDLGIELEPQDFLTIDFEDE